MSLFTLARAHGFALFRAVCDRKPCCVCAASDSVDAARSRVREVRRTQCRPVSKTSVRVLLIAVLVTGTLCQPSRAQLSTGLLRNDASPQVSPLQENFVTVEKLRVRYVVCGSGPAVVMIHGNAGSIEDFEFGAIETLSSNYRVIAIDRPGHGKSDRPNGKTVDVEHQARLLHQLLSYLGVVRPVLLGHSWGAALVLSYVLQYPTEVSALILVAPAAYPEASEAGFLQAMNKPPVIGEAPLLLGRSFVGRHILRRVLRRAFFPQPLPEKYFQSVAASWLGRKQLKAYLDDESSLNSSLRKFSKQYSEINVPVVIITGDQDQIVSPIENAYRLKDSIANSRLIELRNTGHEIPQTQPESLSSALSLIRSPVAAAMH
jgi:pimeloyl-ACP methyl ester carboxylesterase